MNTTEYQEKRVQELKNLEQLQESRGEVRHTSIQIQELKIHLIEQNLEEEKKILEILNFK